MIWSDRSKLVLFRDLTFWEMSRPKLFETKKFGGCRDQDQPRLSKSCWDRDFIESLVNHCSSTSPRQPPCGNMATPTSTWPCQFWVNKKFNYLDGIFHWAPPPPWKIIHFFPIFLFCFKMILRHWNRFFMIWDFFVGQFYKSVFLPLTLSTFVFYWCHLPYFKNV